MTVKKTTKEEKERLEKRLAAYPGMIVPTRDKSELVFDPIEIRGEPLSQTIIKARREARY